VVQTGERRFYGCFAFKKGVIPPRRDKSLKHAYLIAMPSRQKLIFAIVVLVIAAITGLGALYLVRGPADRTARAPRWWAGLSRSPTRMASASPIRISAAIHADLLGFTYCPISARASCR
jgi:hypothetical protein